MTLRRLIVGVDFSRESEIAMYRALDVATQLGSEIVVVHVSPTPEAEYGELDGDSAEEYRKVVGDYRAGTKSWIEDFRDRFSGHGVSVMASSIDGVPAIALCNAARELDGDAVIVGTHGLTGVKWLLLGSVAERVVRDAGVTVMVARGDAQPGPFERLLVPTDFSETSAKALELAIQVADRGGHVDLIHFWQMPAMSQGYYVPGGYRVSMSEAFGRSVGERAAVRAKELMTRHKRASVTCQFQSVQAAPVQGIQKASRNYDIVVMGSHGRQGVSRWVLGSVSERTVRHAACSVIVVR